MEQKTRGPDPVKNQSPVVEETDCRTRESKKV
jgi:hypothetical protein